MVCAEELTRQVKDKAGELGFSAVAVTPAVCGPEELFLQWLARGYHGEMAYMARNPAKRVDPRQILPGARSIVSAALNYHHPYSLPYRTPTRGAISRYASGEDYHGVLEQKLSLLLSWVKQIRPGSNGRCSVDSGTVLDKYWAQRAGIGWLGKHTNVIRKGLGSWFFIGELILDCEMVYDVPAADHCGSCRRCIDACPTGAIVEPYVLDSRRCISYLTIELRGDIPEHLREPMGNLILGCDICQDVCPWNRKAPVSPMEEFAPLRENRAPELQELARLNPEQFRARFRNSAIRRAKWSGLLRNVAVALGNSKDPQVLPELRQLLKCEEPVVRRHAAWGLYQLGGEEAYQAIQQRIAVETDLETLKTLENLLFRPWNPEKSAHERLQS
ncbi:MAG: tRNA epoxyqueuosine(34) reductase QueG [Acidobacteria bacterium]|nr:tRNA epoxyqueuosine(34) reductase QueG [Acidobacteriota bacterium]